MNDLRRILCAAIALELMSCISPGLLLANDYCYVTCGGIPANWLIEHSRLSNAPALQLTYEGRSLPAWWDTTDWINAHLIPAGNAWEVQTFFQFGYSPPGSGADIEVRLFGDRQDWLDITGLPTSTFIATEKGPIWTWDDHKYVEGNLSRMMMTTGSKKLAVLPRTPGRTTRRQLSFTRSAMRLALAIWLTAWSIARR